MLTDAQLQQIMPRLDAAKLQLYLPHLNIALQTHGVDTSFKGRGPIQITGRFNHAKYGALPGVDLVAQLEPAAKRKASVASEPLLRGQESIRRIRVATTPKESGAKVARRIR